jgi:hypothetical protein
MNLANTNLTVELEICMKCGLCCDGTLFSFGLLKKGEKEFLPTLLQKRIIVTEKVERFKQPCPYFNKNAQYIIRKNHVYVQFSDVNS